MAFLFILLTLYRSCDQKSAVVNVTPLCARKRRPIHIQWFNMDIFMWYRFFRLCQWNWL